MTLPKFLFADDGEDDPREFVIHNHWPRFIMEFWDPEPEIIKAEIAAGREPPRLIARLMREAGEFYNNYITDHDID